MDPAVFDKAAALARVEDDEELLVELAGLFVDEAPGLLAQMREALATGDAPRLERAAHSLKGSASNIDAPETTQTALALETLVRDGGIAQAAPLADNVEAAVVRLTTELGRLVEGGTS